MLKGANFIIIIEWFVKTLEFIPDVIQTGLLFLAYWFVTTKIEFLKRIKSRNMNQNQNGYAIYVGSYGSDNNRDYLPHYDNPNDNDTFLYMRQQNDDSENYYGESTGEFILRGGSLEDLDYSNPNHYPLIESYDNNSENH